MLVTGVFQRLQEVRQAGRIALVTELDVEGKNLVVYNLHLESRGPGYNRFEQLKETLADAKSYPQGTPIILAGDLNTKYFPSRFVALLEAAGFHEKACVRLFASCDLKALPGRTGDVGLILAGRLKAPGDEG